MSCTSSSRCQHGTFHLSHLITVDHTLLRANLNMARRWMKYNTATECLNMMIKIQCSHWMFGDPCPTWVSPFPSLVQGWEACRLLSSAQIGPHCSSEIHKPLFILEMLTWTTYFFHVSNRLLGYRHHCPLFQVVLTCTLAYGMARPKT